MADKPKVATLDQSTTALMLTPAPERSVAVERLVAQAHPAVAAPMPRRELVGETLVGAAFLVAAIPTALLLPAGRAFHPLAALLLVGVYAIVSRIEFDVGAGYGTPTQLVLVPMLFALPARVVPLLIALGWLAGRSPLWLSRRRHPDGAVCALANSWHALGPALVLALAGVAEPAWRSLPILLAALGAQIAADFLATTAREWIRLGEAPHLSLRLLTEVWATDVCLAPLALGIALLAIHQPAAALLPLPLCGLLTYFARDRRTRIEQALELSQAYRGTALLLGDLVEADDAYTGSHSRDVVDLALAVAPALRLDPDQLRALEFAALLHDVGKITIPKSIINKPGALTDEERAIINTHTIAGERMLEHIGGVLGRVGRIVRSCHERPDGLGYPDGLAGNDVPVEARIIACCDAFNAMTTDRPYRKALSLADALGELRAQCGKQFDPEVVAALLELYAEDERR